MTISTVNTKQQQLENGYFKTGSGSETILILGSCRSVPYTQYFHDWNEKNNNRFTIVFIDPYNHCFDLQDNRTDFESTILSLEKDERVLSMLKTVDIFIHEYYVNFGLFNCAKECEKNIYKFGMNPKVDISIPAYNDIFILTRDIVNFDTKIRKMAIADYNVTGKLSDATYLEIKKVSDYNLNKFLDICSKTSFPEFAEMFKRDYKFIRMFWTSNHIAKAYTLQIFSLIVSKLGLNCTQEFYNSINKTDMYANNETLLCEYDLDYHWNEEIKPLRDSL